MISEEDEFNDEFDRAAAEQESCPVCHRGPVELGNMRDDEDNLLLYAVCEVGHMYVVEAEEDDGS